MRSLERRHVVKTAAEEHRRSDRQHGDVDHSRKRHRNQHVDPREAVEAPGFGVVLRNDPALSQRRVQVDHVRHHSCAEDADGEQDGLVAFELRQDSVLGHRAERRMGEPQLGDVTRGNHTDEGRDDCFERTEAPALQTEDRERRRPCDQRGREERDPKQ